MQVKQVFAKISQNPDEPLPTDVWIDHPALSAEILLANVSALVINYQARLFNKTLPPTTHYRGTLRILVSGIERPPHSSFFLPTTVDAVTPTVAVTVPSLVPGTYLVQPQFQLNNLCTQTWLDDSGPFLLSCLTILVLPVS